MFAQDLTEDLENNGMLTINYTNETLDIDFMVRFLHKSLVEQFSDESAFQNLLEASNNWSFNVDFNHSIHTKADYSALFSYVAEGIAFVMLGLVCFAMTMHYTISSLSRAL